MFQKTITYDDLLMVPKFSDIVSRSEIVLDSSLDSNIQLYSPLISAPMDTVTEVDMCIAMSKAGGLGIIHRYNSIRQQVDMARLALNTGAKYVGAAIGSTGDFLERAYELVNRGTNVVCVDVAHGDHISVKKAVLELDKLSTRSKFHLMAGNIATGEAYTNLANWGVDSVRVGVGGGAICSTRINTGHGVPNMSALFDCVNARKSDKCDNKPTIVIDGGIKTAGDIVKALAAGADFVMAGSLFAGTDQSPGNLIKSSDGSFIKEYRGMASREAQMDWRGKTSAPEGISTFINYKGSVHNILNDLLGNIRSGLSYSGARNLQELRQKVTFVLQSSAGMVESSTHILSRNAK